MLSNRVCVRLQLYSTGNGDSNGDGGEGAAHELRRRQKPPGRNEDGWNKFTTRTTLDDLMRNERMYLNG